MDDKLTINTNVAYADVDRHEVLLLSSLFKFLQEGAIKHADQYDMGTKAMARGESWVLNRMALQVHRYPRYEDAVRIETWSAGINGFRGYREYRMYTGEELAVSGSSLWLYINLSSKALVRVPEALAQRFPAMSTPMFEPGIDRMPITAPSRAERRSFPVTVRYSDLDANGHVNNTAYIDFVQTALVRAGLSASPKRVDLKFAREIPPETEAVNVALSSCDGGTRFSIEQSETVFAVGRVK